MLAFIEVLGPLRARAGVVFMRMDEVSETLHPGDDVVLVSAFLFGTQRFRHMQASWKSQRRMADTFQNLFACGP
jgi:hypothetical protein